MTCEDWKMDPQTCDHVDCHLAKIDAPDSCKQQNCFSGCVSEWKVCHSHARPNHLNANALRESLATPQHRDHEYISSTTTSSTSSSWSTSLPQPPCSSSSHRPHPHQQRPSAKATSDHLRHANPSAFSPLPEPQTPSKTAPCPRHYNCSISSLGLSSLLVALLRPPSSHSSLSPFLLSALVLFSAFCVRPLSACYKYPAGKQDPCIGSVCQYGADCMPSIDGKTARCQCPSDCPSYGDNMGSKPVCGSDGKDYENMCELRKAACHQLKNIKVKYHGRCDPCEGFSCEAPERCMVNEKREPECRCNYHCYRDMNLVCGTDGRTYSNQCLLKMQACKSKKDIRVMYEGKCSPENNPCNKVKCGPQEECSVDRKGSATCSCPPPCEPVLKRVCGNNSVTYDNECELRRHACQEKAYVGVQYLGPCESDSPCTGHECRYGAMCMEQRGKAVCRCPQCSEEYAPVCGENGITFENDCKRNQENCFREEDVQVKASGPCNECGRSRCEFYAVCESINGVPRCVCPKTCVQVDAPVCGSDGVTYANECELRVQSCKQEVFLSIASTGTCDKCRGVQCKYNAKCEDGLCICPILCPNSVEPVCGSNGKTYVNQCEMRKTSCAKSVDIEVKHDGECDGDLVEFSGSGDVCNCNPTGSYGTTCDPQTHQCVCKPGVQGKTCDHCDMGYWGLRRIGEEGNSGCIPCNCNRFGSIRDDCEQMTGRCMCKSQVIGMKCDKCRNHKVLGPDGCKDTQAPQSCAEMNCQFGATCKEGFPPSCVCDYRCDTKTDSEMVCGSDGVNYGSECQLRLFGCRLNKEIIVLHRGPCKGGPPTTMTTHSPTKSRKTTRHINGREDGSDRDPGSHGNGDGPHDINKDTCTGSKIDELCLGDEDCCPDHSYCRGLCYCKEGYIASLDNTECYKVTKEPEDKYNVSNACTINPCIGGGECILDDLLGYRCACPIGKGGSLCSRDVQFETPSFSGRSYLQLAKIDDAYNGLSIDIVFSALNKDGIILYNAKFPNGSGDFVSITMNSGYIEFRFDLGAGPAILRSRNKVELLRSHRIIATRDKENGRLTVDNEDPVKGMAPSTHTSLDLTDPLLLGYIPKASEEVFKRVGVHFGLVGCIYSLKAGSISRPVSYDLSLHSFTSDIIDGVDIRECGKNPCKSMPCKNSATCLVLDAQIYECRCKVGYKGTLCEELINPCGSQPCQYGGTCIQTSSSDGFFCQCPHGREGMRCERESNPQMFVPQFTGDSYMEMPLEEKISNSLSVTVWFKAIKPNGVIFFATQSPGGRGDFISLNMRNKKLIFTFFLGHGIGKIESKKHIHLEKWHEVTVRRTGTEGEMTIDKHPPIKGQASSTDYEGSSSVLNIDNRPLYLGGFRRKEDLPFGAEIENGFTGAIQRIIINGRTIDGLMATALTLRNISTYNGPPCNVNPCMNGGVCIPILSNVECRCSSNFMGVRCEKRYDHVDKDQPLMFDGMKYLSYPNEIKRKQEGQQSNNFEVTFRAQDPTGILLLQTGGDSVANDFFSVALFNGYPELSYNLGKNGPGDLFKLQSTVNVMDGKWHILSVSRNKREGSIQVDEEQPVIESSKSGAQQLDTDGLLWVGGKSSFPWGLPVMKNFAGCIDSVKVNGQELHLVDDKNGHSTSITFCSLK